jgi:hypothetical protein
VIKEINLHIANGAYNPHKLPNWQTEVKYFAKQAL